MAPERPGLVVGQAGLELDDDHEIADRSRARAILVRDPAFWVGAILVLLVAGSAALAPLIAPHPPDEQFRDLIPDGRLSAPPNETFPLGTDQLGRDYLSRLLWAGRATLLVGLTANTLAVVLGLAVGLVAGFVGTPRLRVAGGWSVGLPVESGLMRLTDIGLAFPALLLAIALTAVLGRSLEVMVIVIAAVLWTTTARVIYGRVLTLRSREFLLAARALGTSTRGIIRRHLLPQVLPLALVYAALGFATVILFEAALSFLGAGAPVGTPTWGAMLQRQTGSLMSDPRLPLLPAIAIFVTVLGFNLLADAVRDAMDPLSQRA
jgi:peptide/nickel transport system permease protein